MQDLPQSSQYNIFRFILQHFILDWKQCGISITKCALGANKEERALVFVINIHPFTAVWRIVGKCMIYDQNIYFWLFY